MILIQNQKQHKMKKSKRNNIPKSKILNWKLKKKKERKKRNYVVNLFCVDVCVACITLLLQSTLKWIAKKTKKKKTLFLSNWTSMHYLHLHWVALGRTTIKKVQVFSYYLSFFFFLLDFFSYYFDTFLAIKNLMRYCAYRRLVHN
jgi:hypothetical protein